MADRENLLTHVKEIYGTSPESPRPRFPNYAVLRHAENGKWYGLSMNLPRHCLHLAGTGERDVVNLKRAGVPGAFPAHHINERHWISLALGGTFPDEDCTGSWRKVFN